MQKKIKLYFHKKDVFNFAWKKLQNNLHFLKSGDTHLMFYTDNYKFFFFTHDGVRTEGGGGADLRVNKF